MPPPFRSTASTLSDAQYSAHASVSSVSGSRSLKLICPHRRITLYQGTFASRLLPLGWKRLLGVATETAVSAMKERLFMVIRAMPLQRPADSIGASPNTCVKGSLRLRQRQGRLARLRAHLVAQFSFRPSCWAYRYRFPAARAKRALSHK